jgi:hypothetical protein
LKHKLYRVSKWVLPEAHFKMVLAKECSKMDAEEEETNMRYHTIVIFKNYKIGHSYNEQAKFERIERYLTIIYRSAGSRTFEQHSVPSKGTVTLQNGESHKVTTIII